MFTLRSIGSVCRFGMPSKAWKSKYGVVWMGNFSLPIRGLREISAPPKEIVIVGGIAGGASAAARARRLNEDANITILDRGSDVSVGTCGMPYFLGGEIKHTDDLLVVKPHTLREWFRLQVRTGCNVVQLDTHSKCITVQQVGNEEVEERIPYDKLILATGARAIRPNLPGADLKNVHTLRSIHDLQAIEDQLATGRVKHITIVGGGFIGLELAENLKKRGFEVVLLEKENQILKSMDPEMTAPLLRGMREKDVIVRLEEELLQIEELSHDRLQLRTSVGPSIDTDMVLMALGVKPDSSLAEHAGLSVTSKGAIKVNEYMQTSDPHVYAVGDVVEVKDFVPREKVQIPLAGPANRQGRIAADHIFGAGDSHYRGTQGSSIVRVFDHTAAQTGATERTLDRLGWRYSKLYVHPNQHAGYYPGATAIHLKVLFDPFSGRILGAQASGAGDGVDKRIDVLATAIQGRMTVFDLEELECCYSPPFNSAKDPNNFAGFVGAGLIRGEQHQVYFEQLDRLVKTHDSTLLDVRDEHEYEAGSLEGAINVPLGKLRSQIDQIPADRPIVAFCRQGMRGYVATRYLRSTGRLAYNLAGGHLTALDIEYACGYLQEE